MSPPTAPLRRRRARRRRRWSRRRCACRAALRRAASAGPASRRERVDAGAEVRRSGEQHPVRLEAQALGDGSGELVRGHAGAGDDHHVAGAEAQGGRRAQPVGDRADQQVPQVALGLPLDRVDDLVRQAELCQAAPDVGVPARRRHGRGPVDGGHDGRDERTRPQGCATRAGASAAGAGTTGVGAGTGAGTGTTGAGAGRGRHGRCSIGGGRPLGEHGREVSALGGQRRGGRRSGGAERTGRASPWPRAWPQRCSG